MSIPKRAMPAAGMLLAIIALAGSVASAQPRVQDFSVHQYRGPSDAELVTRVFYPTHLNAPQDLQELVNLIRVITDTQRMFPNSARESIALRGTAAQADLAEWLFRELDKPADSHDSGKHEYRAPGDNDLVTRIFYPAHIKTAQGIQELVNAIRTIADAPRLFPDAGQQAIALRGTAAQVAMVEWLVNALDIGEDGLPAGAQRRPSATYPYPELAKLLPSGAKNPAWAPGDTVVRVFYLAHTGTSQGVQEAVNAIRTVAEIARDFPFSAPKAVVSRGTASQDALAEWLLNEMDTPAGATAP
jgi:hypothetical protein